MELGSKETMISAYLLYLLSIIEEFTYYIVGTC